MSIISVIRIDTSRWQEARALRLEALQQDPTAFISSYADEVQFDDDRWLQRVQSGYDKQENITLYAESNTKLVGMLGANWSNRSKIQHVANIYGVYVSPSVRGQGIGSLLLQSLLDELGNLPRLEKVKLTVTATQTSARALYKKYNFEIVGIAKKEVKIDDTYYDEIYMERFL